MIFKIILQQQFMSAKGSDDKRQFVRRHVVKHNWFRVSQRPWLLIVDYQWRQGPLLRSNKRQVLMRWAYEQESSRKFPHRATCPVFSRQRRAKESYAFNSSHNMCVLRGQLFNSTTKISHGSPWGHAPVDWSLPMWFVCKLTSIYALVHYC